MGSPINEIDRSDDETQHKVILNAFRMSKYAITFEQYDAYCDTIGKMKPNDEGWGRGKRPVINVSWEDANSFAQSIGCRLPTEAEWEYACRAGTTTPFNTGNKLTATQANYYLEGDYRQQTLPVGSYNANAFGLYDMHGNVWEWCSDWLNDYSTTIEQNPQGPSSGTIRSRRGGCWSSGAIYCRSANRLPFILSIPPQDYRDHSTGFRIVSDEKE
jgi:formylglycine-generating enzyme required for sulfatase activity